MKALSENEISALLSSAASREYTDITSCVKIAPEIMNCSPSRGQ